MLAQKGVLRIVQQLRIEEQNSYEFRMLAEEKYEVILKHKV